MFQSTHPHGVRRVPPSHPLCISSFNPRTHMGCDARTGVYDTGLSVSIHAPTWGATRCMYTIITYRQFQSTHPHGVRQRYIYNIYVYFVFQSTHPHGVRRVVASSIADEGGVSIHAPTWGATWCARAAQCKGLVSIHAPTWGATDHDVVTPKYLQVSIHAPTWGATLSALAYSLQALFQSTHPHGVRRIWPDWRNIVQSFNPRTHMGCDLYITTSMTRYRFQSTHPHGVRQHDCAFNYYETVSIHAPTWGATGG